jgi:uncharacterized repeat protein (TIGR01451 family)
MRRFSRFLILAAITFMAGTVANTALQAQDHLIGEDQSVNRVIQLRSSAVKPPVLPKAIEKTSRTVQPRAVKPNARVARAPQVQFDEIKPGTVPSVLQSTRNATTRIEQRSNMGAPLQVQSNMIKPNQKRGWEGTKIQTAQAGENWSQTSTEPLSVTNSAPVINTMIEAPRYINLNQTATMRIKMMNVGETTARQVRLIATLPEHAKFARAIPRPTRSEGQTHEFLLTNVAAKQMREIAIDLVPTQKSALDISTEVIIENTQRIAIAVREPKLKMKLKGPTVGHTGQSLTHQIVIENNGDGLAEDIRLKIKLPNELQPTKTNGELVIPSIQPGRSVIVDFETVAKTAGQTEINVLATANGIDAQTESMDMTIHEPELEVSAVGPQMNFVNREGIYTIKINNTGQVDVSDVNITLQVPKGMQVTTISQDAAVDAESGLLVWSFEKIASQTEQVIQLKTLAIAAGEQVCTIAVRSNETRAKDIRLSTQVATRADMSVSIKNQSGPVQVGGQAQFQVIVENKGSSSANDVTVNIELPESLKPVREGGQTQEFGNSISFRDAQIEPGQKREFLFSAVGVTKGEHVVRSILQTAGSERRIIVEGSVYVYEVNESRVSESLSPVVR